MATVNVNIRMDENLKKQMETILDSLGMNVTTGFNIFAKAVVREHGIPFELKADPFYSEENMRVLYRAIQDADAGKLTVHDLIED
ncbi:MAG: type II toxin-antitoxin system RelB/DinJ family antitoxin [Oscillospiraceae bacterium]|nr:type II toxin-antitoxin system RelB/DinJ family antitoxin [Oscillospiraceae bacterium]